ncbi:zinc finger protein 64-like [Neocloeon triangulifer]|uniref:zinc finger protein 64-like n=1 Tax=Neocloeon triangulifer TaxID=2078957 RepID=UPI00286F16D5|nr:zinc finger protein 64-like [Neocloeon triangulifer]
MCAEFCRFCDRPGAEGGYRASELDVEKLEKWFSVNLDIKFADKIQDDDFFCYFCVWDARFVHENKVNGAAVATSDDLCWWPDLVPDNARTLFNSYKAGEVLPCSVSLDAEEINLWLSGGKKKNGPDQKQAQNSSFECVYCNKSFNQKGYVAQHVFKIHPDIALRCDYKKSCTSFFKSLKEKDDHIRKFHLTPKVEPFLVCIYCEKRNLTPIKFALHMRKVHSDISIRCKNRRCVSYFKTQADFDKHWAKEHKNLQEIKKFKCSMCKYESSNNAHLAHHEATKHLKTEESFQCPQCFIFLVSKVALKEHLDLKHRFRVCPACQILVPMKSFDCHFTLVWCWKCKTESFCRGLNRQHLRTCKGQPLTCDFCGQIFTMKTALQCHISKMHLSVNYSNFLLSQYFPLKNETA